MFGTRGHVSPRHKKSGSEREIAIKKEENHRAMDLNLLREEKKVDYGTTKNELSRSL